MKRALLVVTLAFGFVSSANVSRATENWPQFRGPSARATSDNKNLPDRWTATENVAWKRDIGGLGWASPIVWGDRVIVTTVVAEGENEDPKKGLYFGGERRKVSEVKHQWKVICLSLKSGDVLWERVVYEGPPPQPRHVKNSYASETPATDGQRIYAYFGNVGVFCLDMEGKPVWEKRLEPKKTRYGWGTASSPIVYKDRVYVVNDNDEESYLLALDAKSGGEIWRVAREEKSNWATPFVWENRLRTEIVTPGTTKVRAYDLAGKVLYELGGMSSITIPTPQAKGDLLYVSSGYVLDAKKPIFAIKPGGSGDISLKADATKSAYVAWCQPGAGPYNPSPLVDGDYVYVLYDRGFFGCFDAKIGAEVYGKQRIPDGRAFTASPWAYGGKVYCLNEDGATFVIPAGKEFKIEATNPLADDDMSLASPALAGDRLVIRTMKRVYCIRKKSA